MQGDPESEGVHGACAEMAGGGDVTERFTTWLEPTTVEEAQEAVREAPTVISLTNYSILDQVELDWVPAVCADKLAQRIDTNGPEDLDELAKWVNLAYLNAPKELTVLSPKLTGSSKVTPEDFVAEIPARWPLERMKFELEQDGLALPHSSIMWLNSNWPEEAKMTSACYWHAMSLADHVGWNMPHLLSAQHGTWRDWVLACTFLTADGELCRSGSRVTKNVAGFDFHKFLIGSRSAFAIPMSFTLRVVPLSAVKEPEIRVSAGFRDQRDDPSSGWVIQRVQYSDFEGACREIGGQPWFADVASRTIYRYLRREEEVKRYPGDWVQRVGIGATWPEFTEAEAWVIRRTKALLDPTNKLNPGILGIV